MKPLALFIADRDLVTQDIINDAWVLLVAFEEVPVISEYDYWHLSLLPALQHM